MPTHYMTFAFTDIPGGNNRIQNTVTIAAPMSIELEESVPDATTDRALSVAIDVSAMTDLYMVSTAALTIQTNSGSSPDDTIVLEANKPLVWRAGGTGHPANPLGTDVTAIYLTNASGSAATFRMWVGVDSTP